MIFLILMVQFRTISDPLVIMASIPLTLLGAVVGLLASHNPFGFTAFMGMISLTGIVVRNGIVLVDYIHMKMREGHSLEDAATEAGERRLRPIFLTTMAAAVGVTPMILSRSSLWSPLASVIAMGLIFSMFFTLLVVPVLFVLVNSRSRRVPSQAAVALVLAVLMVAVPAGMSAQQTLPQDAPDAPAAQAMKLTLPQSVELAIRQNRSLRIARAKTSESASKVVTAKSDLYPHLNNDMNVFGLSNYALLMLSLALLGSAVAQPTCHDRRATVGVALSGGSALGLAHIGACTHGEMRTNYE